MPFNGTGGFDPLPPPTYPAVAGEVIRASYFNAVIDDIKAGLSQVLVRDGQAPITGNVDLTGHKFTNAADAVTGQGLTTLAQNDLKYLTRAVGAYATSSDGKSRLFFVGNGATYVRGHDATTPFAVENATGVAIASFRNDGRVSCTADATAPEDLTRLGQVTTAIATGVTTATTAATAAATAAAQATQIGGTSQTLQDLTASRVIGTPYTNSTGRPINVLVSVVVGPGSSTVLVINGAVFSGQMFGNATGGNVVTPVSFVVPDGVTYELRNIAGGNYISTWVELR